MQERVSRPQNAQYSDAYLATDSHGGSYRSYCGDRTYCWNSHTHAIKKKIEYDRAARAGRLCFGRRERDVDQGVPPTPRLPLTATHQGLALISLLTLSNAFW